MNGYLDDLGLESGMHVMMHAGFRAVKSVFHDAAIEDLLEALRNRLSGGGSLIMPAFTYCFKKTSGTYERFDRQRSPSKVGAVSEVFRQSAGIVRTASPTHSFSLWGAVQEEIGSDNAPESPLGEGSVLDWLTQKQGSYILMLGVGFRALSYAHYIEVMTPVPWADLSPWSFLNVEKTGVSTKGEQPLKEVPGCSKGFVTFETFLTAREIIKPIYREYLRSYVIPVDLLYRQGISYFSTYPERLLCPPGTCKACDVRWHDYMKGIHNTIKG